MQEGVAKSTPSRPHKTREGVATPDPRVVQNGRHGRPSEGPVELLPDVSLILCIGGSIRAVISVALEFQCFGLSAGSRAYIEPYILKRSATAKCDRDRSINQI